MLSRRTVAIATVCILLTTSTARSQEPPWTGPVIARGLDRAAIKSIDMLQRPYRPFHFYGNTLRRAYYRGQALPTPSDVAQAIKVLVTGR